jgi:hypothetical protein
VKGDEPSHILDESKINISDDVPLLERLNKQNLKINTKPWRRLCKQAGNE